MESWREGRDDLFAELTKICNRIDRNVVAEIDRKNFARVSKGELQKLQQSASRVDELVEKNIRLADELREQRSENGRARELEKENKRLGEEIQKLRRGKEASAAKEQLNGPAKSATPASTGLEAKLPGKGREVDKYNTLVMKHNNLHTSHQKSKDDREKLIHSVRKRNADLEEMVKVVESRDRRIESLRKKLGIREGKAKDANREGDVGRLVPYSSKILLKENAVLVEHQDVAVPISQHCQLEVNKATGNPTHTKARIAEEGSCTSRWSPAGSSEANRPMRSEPLMLPNLLGEGRMPVEEIQYADFTQIQQNQRSCPNPQQNSDSTEGEPQSPERDVDANIASITETGEIPDSQDTPLVVSARRIRKRKRPGNENQSASPVKVKVEEIELITSSPIGLAAFRCIDHTDSFDLDEIGEKVDTPKKRRRLLELSRQASRLSTGSGDSSKHGQAPMNNSSLSQQVLSTKHTDILKAGSPLQPLNHNQLLLPRTSKMTTPKSCPLVSDLALKGLSEDAQTVSRSARASRNDTETSVRLDSLLTNPSPPKRILSKAREPSPRHPANDVASRSSSMHQDGSNELNHATNTSASTTSESRKSLEPRQSFAAFSASTNLTRPSSNCSDKSARGLIQKAKHVGISRLNSTCSPDLATPNPRYVQKVTPKSTVSATQNRPRRSEESLRPPNIHLRVAKVDDEDNSVYDVDPEEEPLRIRPLETLKLSDFKVNPKANQGLDYAFTDVVRNRADRRCLPGCTKPECCGTGFRALAEMMMDNPTKSQEEKDRELLEDFMGNNAYKVQNMTTVEREEMLLQAKTRDMANKYGRHRHAYERKRSPPGFWDADFPTTQEHLAEREKAQERERETIEKRYKEAMRPGGAFMFRDER